MTSTDAVTGSTTEYEYDKFGNVLSTQSTQHNEPVTMSNTYDMDSQITNYSVQITNMDFSIFAICTL